MTTEAIAPPSTKSQVLRSFDVADFPALNGLEEEWRFTPLKRLSDLVKATALTGAAPSVEYGDLPAGVTVTTADDVEPVLIPFDRISALAYGSAAGVTVIEVAAEAEPAEAAVIRLVGKGGEAAAARTVVKVGNFAKATVVLEQTGTVTLADNIEVVLGDSAQLTFVTLAEWDRDAVQAQHVRFRVGKDARVQHVQVTLGGDLVRQFTSVEYTGRGGDAELWGLYFADAGQHQEHRQLVDHSVPDCRSYVGYRGALQGKSAHTVWVGDVLIRAAATGTDTYEINRNLVLTDGARADSVPNLEIETGEVAGAGHASATGRFDDEQLFYLMARGIPEAEARKLVVRGFFAELIHKIPVEALRERLGDAIEARLAEAGQ
ncbi:Fe-S cluster assembly protein SufD [Actinoplanes regularis]|uniref:Iron-regulated ABC transporter permease protein SufD n=1 Tax=Actinoplanes regularis TaxID=52697 RepID=A0A238WEJ6_9ACTN|nr:Fe-S cluster assembly protein SufD [Actinoplanes regularis]GIE85038.1 Fe-S cluster assembly protein SufD [Actinoplanes regularis]GLW27225.1 Fe-S cluster assembly protein SufD [Actinoplanes regularis]SNR44089.1 Iron-regulated ABC transporter permease protein SufD [Actinoplanes regularis]